MSKRVLIGGGEVLIADDAKKSRGDVSKSTRAPVHVVYGGADRFSADTPQKLGKIALSAMATYASNFVEFADALRLPGSESLPRFPEAITKLEKQIAKGPVKARSDDFGSWLAWTVYRKTLEKARTRTSRGFQDRLRRRLWLSNG